MKASSIHLYKTMNRDLLNINIELEATSAELLEALEAIMGYYDTGDVSSLMLDLGSVAPYHTTIRRAKQAIARATKED